MDEPNNQNQDDERVTVILTAYKRDYFHEQLPAIFNQSIKPDVVYIWQNEHHFSLEKYREKYNFNLVSSDENAKYLGRFTLALLAKTKYVAIFDDDLIPGKKWLENCLRLSRKMNCIVGQNGRIVLDDHGKLGPVPGTTDTIVNEDFQADLVGHCWFFKTEWLKYLWSDRPYTFETGEDIHFCFLAKMLGNIDSYVPKQLEAESRGNLRPQYAVDPHASFRCNPLHKKVRAEICRYFMNKGWKR